ncbi:MAG: STAS domain-containing protein [Psychrosphaera sp.]|nr:STAS domain-containing protein [Psychrosphaera sp.]
MAKLEANFTIGHSANCLVVTPQGALSTGQIELIRESVLIQLQRGSIAAVVVNLAGVPIIDSVEFEGLTRTLAMIRLMGAKSMLAGIHFGIASALAQMDDDMENLTVVRNVDDALKMVSG